MARGDGRVPSAVVAARKYYWSRSGNHSITYGTTLHDTTSPSHVPLLLKGGRNVFSIYAKNIADVETRKRLIKTKAVQNVKSRDRILNKRL